MGEGSLGDWIDFFQVLAALGLVFLNGLFVAAEFSLVKARPTRISQLALEGNYRAKAALYGIHHMDAYLSVCQLGITLASLGLGWIGEPAIADLITPVLADWGLGSPVFVHSISITIAFILITFLHVVFGELAPKTLAIQKAESLALTLALPMRFFYVIFYPGVVVLNGAAQWMLKAVGMQSANESEQTHTEEELSMIIHESYKGGHIDEREQELLQNVFRFEKRVARDVMVPRPETVFLYLENTFQENIEIARQTGHTRYPVCDETPDRVVGLVHIKDLIYAFDADEPQELQDFMRSILFVPEGMPLDQVLHQFQINRQHMAVVIDEYGGCAGMITMDNLLEELVGDILDEFDEEDAPEYEENNTLVSGRMLLEDAEERFSWQLAEDDDEYSTLGGYVLGQLGKPPQVGDAIIIGGYRLEVTKVLGMRIDQLKVDPWPAEQA